MERRYPSPVMAKPSQPQQPGVESAIPPVKAKSRSDPERIAAGRRSCLTPVPMLRSFQDRRRVREVTGGVARSSINPRLLWLRWLRHRRDRPTRKALVRSFILPNVTRKWYKDSIQQSSGGPGYLLPGLPPATGSESATSKRTSLLLRSLPVRRSAPGQQVVRATEFTDPHSKMV